MTSGGHPLPAQESPTALPPVLAGLVEAATCTPARAAIVRADGPPLSFSTLVDRVGVATADLRARGIADGARAALLVPPGPDFVVALFALVASGAVPVLVDPGIGPRRVGRALAGVRPTAFVGSPRAQVARHALRWAPTADRIVTTGPRWPGRGVTAAPPAQWTPQPAGAEAALLFTSGSTGPPKAVVYRHRQVAAQLRALQTAYGLSTGDVTVTTFAPFALFGPALGMTTVLPIMDYTRPAAADPDHLCDVVHRFAAQVLFASPALLTRLARHAPAHAAELATLRLVLSAGAPVPAAVVATMAGLLAPTARVATPYGMTEALPVSSVDDRDLRATAAASACAAPRGVCIGRPVPGTDVAVIALDEEPLPVVTDAHLVDDGQVGELVVAGPQVSDAYVGRPAAMARAKTTWDGRPAHRTGDLVWRDADGRLWFCGRTVHRVHTAAGDLDPLPVEQLVIGDPRVRRAALVGVPAGRFADPVMVIELEPAASAVIRPWRRGARVRRAGLVAQLRARLAPVGVTAVLLRRALPVDARHNAKVGYEQLARWADARRRWRLVWVGRRAFGGGRG